MKKSIVVMLVLTVMAGLLTGCASKTGNQSENAGDKVVTPTITSMFTPTNTPTATPTPIPHKTKQEVAEELKNVKVSVDDLMNEDVVYTTYFGAVDDNLTDEMIKRISYFDSFGVINFMQAKNLVIYLNYCYLNSDAVDKDKAEKYLAELNTHAAELDYVFMQIIKHNLENPNDQIIISWGAIDEALGKDGRAIINNRQQEMTRALMEKKSFDDIYISTEKYDVAVTRKDGRLMQLTGLYDDLNIAVKGMDSETIFASLEYAIINHNYDSYPSYETIDRLGGYINSIFPAFSDPEHANVRRHGFDANSYYEEDLQ